MAPDDLDPDLSSTVTREAYVTPQLEKHDEWDLVTGLEISGQV